VVWKGRSIAGGVMVAKTVNSNTLYVTQAKVDDHSLQHCCFQN
jgi:hypothetical protein